MVDRLAVPLDSDGAGDRELVGGKAVGLRALRSAGLPSPGGLVVTTHAHRRYLRSVLAEPELHALRRAARRDHAAGRALRDLHHKHPMPDTLTEVLLDGVAGMAAARGFAVRSSAVCEDGQRSSFAGLHTSVLGVLLDEVEPAVRQCWASLWSPAAVEYRRDGGDPDRDEAMAVVVQPVSPAVAAAVVFTRDPVTDPDLLRVEAVPGPGAPLVAGAADPDVFLLDRVTLAVVDRRAGAVERPAAAVLEERAVRRLADCCLRAERAFRASLDVEAVLGDDSSWTLVQARPITAATGRR